MRFFRQIRSFAALLLLVVLTVGLTAYAVYADDNEDGFERDRPRRDPASFSMPVEGDAPPSRFRPPHARRGDVSPPLATAPVPASAPKADSTAGWDYAVEPTPAFSSHRGDAGTVNEVGADDALERLRHGNLRFQQGKPRKSMEGMGAGDRNRLLGGQRPYAMILACSDSRVPPELVFDQRLGEVIVVRSAGETIDNAVLASIEHAVSYLGVQLLLVLGHDSCGAVETALRTMPNAKNGSPYLDFMVADIQPRVATSFRQPSSTGLLRESALNARGAARDLIQRSAIVRERVSAGKLQVRSALYHLDTGLVDFD